MTEVPSRRVLLLTAGLGPGGLERQLRLLATHLPARWRAVVLSLNGGQFVDELQHSDVAVRIGRRRGRLDLLPFAGLSRFIIATRPDVVHFWHWLPAAAAAPVCRLLHIPLVDGTVRSGRPSGDCVRSVHDRPAKTL